jgi:hypothetical protein
LDLAEKRKPMFHASLEWQSRAVEILEAAIQKDLLLGAGFAMWHWGF